MSLANVMVCQDFNIAFEKTDSAGIFQHEGKIEACETVSLLEFINGIFYPFSSWPVGLFKSFSQI